MFKVTIWYKTSTTNLSHGPQALIPDSIAATFSIKLSSRGMLEEQTTYQNPDVAVFSNHRDCNDSSIVIGVKFIFKTNITEMSRIIAIVRYEFARTLRVYGVTQSEDNIVLSITPASDTYSSSGFWNIEESDSIPSNWETRLGERPESLSAFTSFSCSQHVLMGRSNRLPGLDRSHQVNTDTGLSQDITRGGTIDPNNNPNPDYLNPNPNQNPGLNIPLIPIVGGVVVLGILTAVYLNQKSKQKTQ